ncbi:MAG: S8 family peptidase, partial [Planctomycetota bacterium]
DAEIVQFSSDRLPTDAISDEPFDREKPEPPPPEPGPPDVIHPLLVRWLAERDPSETELIVINFRDDLQTPRFPEPATNEPRESETNERAAARAQELVREITARRDSSYARLAQELGQRHGAEVLETFWLVNAVLVRMPLGAVRELAQRDDVLFLEPEQTEDEPPQDGNNNNDVDDGRARVVSDPYFNVGLARGWIGLLDTGLRFSHTQFNSPDHIALAGDCINGGSNCFTGTGLNPNDDCWNHGTSSGAIITANANQGAAFRGVTEITLDSWKVYPTSFNPATGACIGSLSTTASVNGFQTAVLVLDRVIVAEMQGSGNFQSTISVAADNAFDAGAVIIAANGNRGPNASTVNVPANAHKVIGVGNFDVQTLNQIATQSRGPAGDNRFKPDVQAPTNTETASAASDVAFKVFGGTSGATPYAAGVAALLRNWMRGSSSTIDPGQVYSHLILFGQQPYPFNNTSGAGPLRMGTGGVAWWGKVSVADRGTINIPLSTPSGTLAEVEGALWWPETATQSHNDIDLHLIDPSGIVRDFSISIPSVFERARVGGPVASGTWTLRIRGFSVPTGTQTVYWSARARRQ